LLIHSIGNNSAHAHRSASFLPIACYRDIRAAGPFGLADFHDSHNFSVLLLKHGNNELSGFVVLELAVHGKIPVKAVMGSLPCLSETMYRSGSSDVEPVM